MDLHHFHDLYVSNFGPILYIEYLYKFLSFPYDQRQWVLFEILDRIESVSRGIIKVATVTRLQCLVAKLEKEYDNANEERKSNGNDGDKLFCKACNKLFSKETVYQSHLSERNIKRTFSTKPRQLCGLVALVGIFH